ncbi:sensor histidine kinase, partial [Candidatus Poribacteria bacterium]|nr:sensor histidine kinase [Candidatus Poribacteria bacterium]
MPSDYNAITEHNEDQLGKDTSSRKTQVSMYSDPTHFIYEILQNADDHGATEVLFKLSKDAVMIEHNGEPFKEENVKAITYFGKSTSREDLVKTGRFGIGFKSVFAFTATPIIISWPEHFEIYGLYRVKEHLYPEGFSRDRTRIILPFNHESEQPDYVEKLVSPDEAYQQISECLTKLDMNTLLFMQNIRNISWKIENRSMHYWREDEIDENSRSTFITNGVLKKKWLVFSKVPTWENERHKAVEIAFVINEQHQITSIDDDFLYVLFPTTENTGLKFLLNGPYRTNPARETISKTDTFNVHLMKVTCELMKELLPKLKDRKLLNVQFLSVLPNKEDEVTDISNRLQIVLDLVEKQRGLYSQIHDVIVNEFRNQKLTPTKRKDSYAPAKDLYRGTREMSGVIQDDDLATLLGKDRHLSLWVANPPLNRRRDDRGRFVEDENATKQNMRINDFLDTLDIPKWDVEDLIKTLESKDEPIIEWLKAKTDEWHQDFYAFLDDSPSYYEDELSELRIVRCTDGEYRIGSECHFFGDDVDPNEDLLTVSTVIDDSDHSESQKEEIQEENFHYVDPAVYSFGDNKIQQESTQKFLKIIGVCEVDETERVKVILKQRYRLGSIKPREGDMERFIALVKDKPESKLIFKDYYIFEVDLQRDNKRFFRKPGGVFVDSPYLDTGLTAYFEGIDEDSDSFKRALSPNYAEYGSNITPEEIGKFAETIGAQTKLEAIKRPIDYNDPNLSYLIDQAEGNFRYDYGNNEDYIIPELKILYVAPSITKSNLIWRTMQSLPEKCLNAWYWTSKKDRERGRPPGKSSLVHELKKKKWVPQKDENSISFVRPCDASVEMLPKGFPYEAEQKWLKAIEFGRKTNEQKEEHTQRNQQAKERGYDSAAEAEEVDAIYRDFKEQGGSPQQLRERIDPQKRRTKLLILELDNAPPKEYEQRARSVRVSNGTVEQRPYLTTNYTDDNRMVCQMCKKEMPFKKRNSNEDYFEAVEALGKDHFPIEHRAQYLAFCPECAAKYKEFVKRDQKVRETFYKFLINSDVSEISLLTNNETIYIWFAEKHWNDLKTVLY